MKKIIMSALSGPLGDTSIKRIVGALCAFSLVIALFFTRKHFDPNLVNSVLILALGCITGTVLEKFSPQIKNMGEKIDLEKPEE